MMVHWENMDTDVYWCGIYLNDGCGNATKSVDCPGEGWVPGMNEETRKKRSKIRKGKKWWNDGCGNNTVSKECPGEGWFPGMMKRK